MLYIPEHVHTIRSINDGILKIDDYIEKAKDLGLPALSITNHGTMSDIFEFYSKCNENDIKPILGCEVYVTTDRLDKSKENKEYSHLILLAKNKIGFENLLLIHNDAQINGFYYKPRTDIDFIREHSEGLICLTACAGGELPKIITNNEIDEEDRADYIEQFIFEYTEVFNDDFYLEIQPGDFPEQIAINNKLIEISEQYNIPYVITNDIHYMHKEDYLAHNIHVCAGRKKTVTMEDDIVYPDTCYYFMSYEDLVEETKHTIPRDVLDIAVKNTNLIADKVENYKIISDHIYMPKYDVPEGFNENSYVEYKCFKQLDFLEVIGCISDPSVYTSRLYYELNTIFKLGFSGYFLTVEDYVMWSKTHDIEVGPGRGSVCGCLVAYLLGITMVDPVKYNLLFERFLSEHRPSPPDVDLDFASDERHRVFGYVIDKYGKDHCSLVSTFTERKSKSAIKDTGRVYGIDPEVYEYVASLVPEVYYNEGEDGDTEKMTDLSIEDTMEIVPEFKKYYEKYPDWINSAIKLSNIPKATSVHAAGTIISPIPLENKIPMIRSKDDNMNATSLNLKDTEYAGFIKFDFLSLATLNVIHHIKKLIGIDDVNKLVGTEYDDPLVWDIIGSKYTSGLFQIGSKTYKQRMHRLQPRTIKELAACLALVRGPCIASHADEKYMRILEGREEIEKIHPIYDKITKETNGILIYQEQLMKICFEMGFTLDEGYKIMKLSAKKKIKELKKYEEKFMEFAREKQMDEKTAHRIFKMIVDTGLYSFNEAHGVAYAILCYITAFFKVYYTKEFLIASLTNAYNRKEEVSDLVQDCRMYGYKFTALNINKSKWEFTNDIDEYINIGFCAVKSFGRVAYEEVESKKPFASFEDFMEKVAKKNCKKQCTIASIFCGAFECFDEDRIDTYYKFFEANKQEVEQKISIQGLKTKVNIHEDYDVIEAAYMEEPLISDPVNFFEPIGEEYIGFNTNFKIKSRIQSVRKIKDKNKNNMAFATICTGDGLFEVVVFHSAYDNVKSYLKKGVVCEMTLNKKETGYIVNDIEAIA